MIELVGTPTFSSFVMLGQKLDNIGFSALTANELHWRLENLRKAEEFWETVTPVDVDLIDWHTTEDADGREVCGTLACFGGHLARAAALGISHDGDFCPLIICDAPTESAWRIAYLSGAATSIWLFGGNLFNSRFTFENGTDYEIVASRISHQVGVLEMHLNKQMLAYGV